MGVCNSLTDEQPAGIHIEVYCTTIKSTGGGSQSWTIFCGPVAVAVGGCERKDQRNLLGSGLSYDGNIAAGTSGSAVAVEIACRQDTTQSSTRNGKI
jgi:hypothetical protein